MDRHEIARQALLAGQADAALLALHYDVAARLFTLFSEPLDEVGLSGGRLVSPEAEKIADWAMRTAEVFVRRAASYRSSGRTGA
jgi:hypothetical protein